MKLILFLIFLCACQPVFAHDLWCEPSDSGLTLYYGHLLTDHAGTRQIEYAPGAIKRVDCFTLTGDSAAAHHTGDYPVRITTSCAVTCILTSTGYWTKTPYGTKNIPRREADYPIASWLSYESVKWIDAWSEALAHPLVSELDIVPLSDPGSLEPGKKIRLLVAFDGKPLEGAVVSYAGKPRGITGTDGTINIRIKQPGLQIIQTSHSVPLGTAEADSTIYTANLNFKIEEDS